MSHPNPEHPHAQIYSLSNEHKNLELKLIEYERLAQNDYDSPQDNNLGTVPLHATGALAKLKRKMQKGYEGGIYLNLHHENKDLPWYLAPNYSELYVAGLDLCIKEFVPGKNNHASRFLDWLRTDYPGKTAYLYKTGNSFHLYLNTLLEQQEMLHFITTAYSKFGHTVVDANWCTGPTNIDDNIHNLVLRWTSGSHLKRPEPRLHCWYQL